MALRDRGSSNGSPTSDWQDISTVVISGKPRRGVHMDVLGLEGQGKSSFALTLAALGPVGYVDIDQSVDRAFKPPKKQMAGVKILPVRYSPGMGEEATKATCGPIWLDLEKKVRTAAETWADGIIIDTATEDWEVLRLGSFGTLNPKGNRMDRLYGPVNARYRTHLRNIYRASGKHLVTIHQLKDEYKDVRGQNGQMQSIKTGKQVRAGFKEMGFLADIVIRVSRKGSEFKALIELCKLSPNGPDLEGQEIDGDQLNFLSIVTLATDTEEGEWLSKKR